LAPARSNLLILSGVGGWARMTLHTQRPGYRFTPQCWQAREANGQGTKEGRRCERDEKTSAACLLHLQISRENVQKCVWLGGK